MKSLYLIFTLAIVSVTGSQLLAGDAPATGTAARLGVREVTAFKDGHAFVRSAGRVPTDPDGHVTLDRLPQPVFGLFWPFAAEKDVRLAGASAGVRPVKTSGPALSVRDLVRVNVGARVLVTEHADPKATYEAVIVGPVAPASGGVSTAAAGSPAELPKLSEVVLLRTAGGVKALPLDQVRSITFPDAYRDTVSGEESRPRLTLRLDWGGRAPRAEAEVGLVYLQKGLRWIPEYKLEIDGRGNARVSFQATLVNELADLDDATVNLVVGVPSFLFKDTLDPMAMAAETPRLSQYFSSNADASMLSNTMVVSQQAFSGNLNRYGPAPGAEPGGAVPPLEGADEGDLHLFTLPHVTLRNGERMVVPVAEFTLKYEDVYTLDVPFVPPLELQRNMNSDRQLELARLLAEPRVKHKLSLANGTGDPLTTAPAVVLRDGRLVAQGMMTYTPPGASCLLELTTAVNIRVRKSEEEVKRTPDALVWHGDRFQRVDLSGSIGLANFGREPVEVVVTRRVLGAADSAGAGGQVQRLNTLEELAGPSWNGPNPGYPAWWAWLDWPYWWTRVNGLGQVRWTVRLEPGQPVQLDYAWHYFWD
jgi:hypothetical protein